MRIALLAVLAVAAGTLGPASPAGERSRRPDDPSYLPSGGWPPAERARVTALLTTLRTASTDPRLTYFRQLLREAGGSSMPETLYPDYVRVARFLYRKEFLSGGTAP